jgi:hypothetical protein
VDSLMYLYYTKYVRKVPWPREILDKSWRLCPRGRTDRQTRQHLTDCNKSIQLWRYCGDNVTRSTPRNALCLNGKSIKIGSFDSPLWGDHFGYKNYVFSFVLRVEESINFILIILFILVVTSTSNCALTSSDILLLQSPT